MESHSRDIASNEFENLSFESFDLKKELKLGIKTCGIEIPSEVQQVCITRACTGIDILCEARNGIGKTLVYIIATLQQLPIESDGIEAIVLCPTRELALQVGEQFRRILKFSPEITVESFFGGLSVSRDEQILLERPPQIVIGTPGRILQLVKRKTLKLGNVKQFIVDECDEIFQSLSMRKTVQEIFVSTPQDKQVMMFSATIPEHINSICKKFMKDPYEVHLPDKELSLQRIQHYYVCSEYSKRIKTLLKFMAAWKFNQAIVFVSNSKRCDVLAHVLEKMKHDVVSVHNGLPQLDRMSRYNEFIEGDKKILVTTNLFSRGINNPRINFVINFDAPNTPINFLHRASRIMAPEGQGMVLTFVCGDKDATMLTKIQNQFDVAICKVDEKDINLTNSDGIQNDTTNTDKKEKEQTLQWAEDMMNRLCDDFESTSFI